MLKSHTLLLKGSADTPDLKEAAMASQSAKDGEIFIRGLNQ